MKLRELYLKKYKRLYVSNIKELHYRPRKKLQVILGMNGSGKSSLLKEVIPNVEELKNDYDQDGYKEAIYEHNQSTYVLKYDRNSNRHSFIKDGKELNDSGLMKIQKQLIEEHFGIRKEIHELLLGQLSFSNMSVSERKKWFTKILTDIDYAYALSTFNKAKERYRDLQSYIKLTRSKLLKDEELLKNGEDYEKELLSKIDTLHKMLDIAIDSKEKADMKDISVLVSLIKEITTKTERLAAKYKGSDFDFDSLLKEERTLESTIKYLEERKKELAQQLKKVDELKITKDDSKSTIEKEMKDIESLAKELTDKLNLDISLEEISKIVREFPKTYSQLLTATEMLSNPELSHLVMDREQILSLQKEYKSLQNQLGNLISKRDSLRAEVEHLLELSKSNKHKCPKCGYEWIEGYSDNLLEDKKKKLSELEEKIKELTEKREDLRELLLKYKDKKMLIDEFKNLFAFDLRPLLDYINNKADIYGDTSNLVSVISDLNILINNYDRLPYLYSRYKELSDKLTVMEKLNSDQLSKLFNRIEKIEDDYHTTVLELMKTKADLDNVRKIISDLSTLKTLREKLYDLLRDYRLSKENMKKNLKNDYLNSLIKKIKEELSHVESQLTEYRTLKRHYKELLKELDNYEKRAMAVKYLVDILSPTRGVIGKLIVSTINQILERMNEIISDIWSYPLEIKPCNIEESDFTFKFPVLVKGEREIPDVSKGSSSMKEVFDLAFRITAMEFLDMLDYPLILDEFGRTMDETHRIRAYDFIEKISRDNFSHVFLVSHFESMYGRFTNVDLIILSDENLSINTTTNSDVFNIK